jgi:NADH dehydrogenase/NADH:ubiquinone oxidoreductase subunit G
VVAKTLVDDHHSAIQTHVTLLNLCQAAGFSDYRFCFHSSLPIAGNCRLCLIELEDFDKQIAACVTNIESSYAMWTFSAFAKKARENVIENLLINHPLDCPICDQGGECDLQDQVKTVGGHRSRFCTKKREVLDKRSGFNIKTIMTRCIHCLRCVRFNKLSGQRFFGVLNRTKKSEVVYHSLDSFFFNVSGMTLELCPVGALTARQYAFKYRPWELRVISSIDSTDSLGSNIYASFKDHELVRFCAKLNVSLNGNVLADKIRYSFDGNGINRLHYTYSFSDVKKKYEQSCWSTFFETFCQIVVTSKVCCVVNEDLDLYSLFYLKTLTYRSCQTIKIFSCSKKNKQNNFYSNLVSSFRALEIVNNICLLLGINPQTECLLLNFKFRLKYKHLLFSLFFFRTNSRSRKFGRSSRM